MSSSGNEQEPGAKAKKVYFEGDQLCLELSDGREIRVPVEFYPRLQKATEEQRMNYKFMGEGTGIHWPDLDEDLSVAGIVAGNPAPGSGVG